MVEYRLCEVCRNCKITLFFSSFILNRTDFKIVFLPFHIFGSSIVSLTVLQILIFQCKVYKYFEDIRKTKFNYILNFLSNYSFFFIYIKILKL